MRKQYSHTGFRLQHSAFNIEFVMPKLYCTHKTEAALEREIDEIYIAIDAVSKRENRIRTLAAPAVPGGGGEEESTDVTMCFAMLGT